MHDWHWQDLTPVAFGVLRDIPCKGREKKYPPASIREIAKEMIDKMGYHRRDKEVEEIEKTTVQLSFPTGIMREGKAEAISCNRRSEYNMRLLTPGRQGLAPLQEQADRNDTTQNDCLFQ